MSQTTQRKVLKLKKPALPVRQTKASIFRLAKTNPELVSLDNFITLEGKKIALPPAVVRLEKRSTSEEELDYMSQSINWPPKMSLNKSSKEKLQPNKQPLQKAELKIPEQQEFKKPLMKPILPTGQTKHNQSTVPKEPTLPKKCSTRRSLSAEHFRRSRQHVVAPNHNVKSIVAKYETKAKDLPKKRVHYEKLEKPLSQWLQKNKKTIDTVHNLKVLGFDEEEDKENMEPAIINRSASYEQLNIEASRETMEEVMQPDDHILKGILDDLYKIITDGYSIDECEKWLDFIETKYKDIKAKAQYWECRAAIERNRGNFAEAMKNYEICLQKTVSHLPKEGALGNLMDKFTLLNIIPDTSCDINNLQKKRILKDSKNIFNSTIIQFEIKENVEKSKNKVEKAQKSPNDKVRRFSATPVKRSTRVSRTKFTTTPGKEVCDSMKKLDRNVQSSLCFEKNRFL